MANGTAAVAIAATAAVAAGTTTGSGTEAVAADVIIIGAGWAGMAVRASARRLPLAAAAASAASADGRCLDPRLHRVVASHVRGFSSALGSQAADQLARANVSFVVLESTNRTGGRSHAITFGDPAVWRGVVERGSNWVSGVAPPGVQKPV